eukprot:3575704-Pleurochrysis_carterae.AAC.4
MSVADLHPGMYERAAAFLILFKVCLQKHDPIGFCICKHKQDRTQLKQNTGVTRAHATATKVVAA